MVEFEKGKSVKQSRRRIRVQSLKNQSLIADKCFVADRFLTRLQGLIGSSRLEPGEGLLIAPCNDIHMWFMSMPIDVVFVKPLATSPKTHATHVVCSAFENVRPWKALPLRDGRASETLELPVGTIGRCEITAGDELCIS